MSAVLVQGSATASVTPDRAQLRLGVSHVEKTAAAALDRAAAGVRALHEVLDRHQIPAADRTTAAVMVQEETEWRDQRTVKLGHRAGTTLTVTIRDIAAVGGVLTDAVSDAGATVHHLAWSVDADNPVRRRLLGDAARDARARAEAYATALGLALGEVLSISELQPEAGRPSPKLAMRAMDAAPLGGAMEVSEGLVELSAAVFVEFALVPG